MLLLVVPNANDGGDVIFTDNFFVATAITMTTVANLNPNSITFAHIPGNSPVEYDFTGPPFGAHFTGTQTSLTLDTGFLGKVIHRSSANGNGVQATGSTSFNNNVLAGVIINSFGSGYNGVAPTVTGSGAVVEAITPYITLNAPPAGVINTIGGTASFGGSLLIDLVGSHEKGDEWDLFDVPSAAGFDAVQLTGSYVASLGESGGLWTGVAGGELFEFNEATGVLRVVPEPTTLGLLAAAGALGLRRRRA